MGVQFLLLLGAAHRPRFFSFVRASRAQPITTMLRSASFAR
jgi:hypothetical protein